VINDEQGAAARGLQARGLAELALFFGRSRAVRSHWLRPLESGQRRWFQRRTTLGPNPAM
jgi:hypothetical protein